MPTLTSVAIPDESVKLHLGLICLSVSDHVLNRALWSALINLCSFLGKQTCTFRCRDPQVAGTG